MSGDQLVIAGGRVGVEFKYVQNYKIAQTDFTTGRYQFGGVWVGKATIRAAGQFSPDPISLDATMPAPNAVVTLDIRLKADQPPDRHACISPTASRRSARM